MSLIELPPRPARNARRITGETTAVDQRSAVLTQISALDTLGGGTLEIDGAVGITGQIDVPDGVQVWGMGSGGATTSPIASKIVCLDAASKIKFLGGFGGACGNFTIDANNLATTPMELAVISGRSFLNVDIMRTVAGGAALLLDGTQNCRFYGCNLQNGSGDGLVIDRGAAGNRFFGLEVAGFDGHLVKFVQTAASPAGAAAQPLLNSFWGGILEDFSGGVESNGCIYHGAGASNHFTDFNFSMPGPTSAVALVTLRKDGTEASGDLKFTDCLWFGSAAQVTGIDAGPNTSFALAGDAFFQHLLRALFVDATATIHDHGARINPLDVTTFFATPNTATENVHVAHRVRSRLEIQRGAAGDIAETSFAVGDTASRFLRNADGAMAWGPGNAAVDTNLYREAANVLATDDKLHVVGEMEIDGALNHDGTHVGLRGMAPVAISAAYTPTNVTTDRSYDADTALPAELADVLGTLIADLQAQGIIG